MEKVEKIEILKTKMLAILKIENFWENQFSKTLTKIFSTPTPEVQTDGYRARAKPEKQL